jgi:hypothetical protein
MAADMKVSFSMTKSTVKVLTSRKTDKNMKGLGLLENSMVKAFTILKMGQ